MTIASVGYIDEKLYMELPEGYTKGSPGEVCKLQKSLCGLKQVGKQWNKKFTEFLDSANHHMIIACSPRGQMKTFL